jgi:hypothetical protein
LDDPHHCFVNRASGKMDGWWGYCEVATSIHIRRPFQWNYFKIVCLVYCVTQLKSKFNTNSLEKKVEYEVWLLLVYVWLIFKVWQCWVPIYESMTFMIKSSFYVEPHNGYSSNIHFWILSLFLAQKIKVIK